MIDYGGGLIFPDSWADGGPPQGHDEPSDAELDREKYHGGPNGSQRPEAGHIGIAGPDGLLYCVGCHWCDR